MIEKIKDLRKEIDGLAQLTKELKPMVEVETTLVYENKDIYTLFNGNSKEINKAVDSLYLAKAWLGKLLGELDVPTPYKNDGKRKSVEDIEPTSDKNEDIHGYNLDVVHFEDKSHVERVDYLRQHIKSLIEKVVSLKVELYEEYKDANSDLVHCLVKYWEYLIEARFYLGFELSRLRNEK